MERVLLFLAVGLFLLVTALALMGFPDTDRPVRWLLLVVGTLLTVPPIAVLNAAEYRISGEILGHRISMVDAFRVSVIASVVNQLPIPGAALVRIRALRRQGSTYGKATGSTATVGLAWIGTTGVVSGIWQLPSDRWSLGLALAGAGVAVLALSYSLIRRQSGAGTATGLLAQLVAVETGTVMLSAVKFWVVLAAIGFPISFGQATVLTVSMVVAAATGFFPGGLGIREVVAGALSPLISLPVAVGLLATAVSRVVGMIGFSVVAGTFLLLGPKSATGPPPEPAVVPHD